MYSEMLLLALMWNIAPTDQLLTTPGVVLMHPVEERIVAKTNAERKRHGLSPCRSTGTWSVRCKHTAWMSRSHSLQHTNAAVGENIAMGQQSSTEAVRRE